MPKVCRLCHILARKPLPCWLYTQWSSPYRCFPYTNFLYYLRRYGVERNSLQGTDSGTRRVAPRRFSRTLTTSFVKDTNSSGLGIRPCLVCLERRFYESLIYEMTLKKLFGLRRSRRIVKDTEGSLIRKYRRLSTRRSRVIEEESADDVYPSRRRARRWHAYRSFEIARARGKCEPRPWMLHDRRFPLFSSPLSSFSLYSF